MSTYHHRGLCKRCGAPLHAEARFCSKCGAPCAQAAVQSDPATYAGKGRLTACCIIFGLSILYAGAWREVYNWFVDLINKPGLHIYWMTLTPVFDVLQALLLAAGSVTAFIFDGQGKKKHAVITAGVLAAVMLAVSICHTLYIASSIGTLAAALGWDVSIFPSCLTELIYPGVLAAFVLWGDRNRKLSFLFPVIHIICCLIWGHMTILPLIAVTLGLSRHWRSWLPQGR